MEQNSNPGLCSTAVRHNSAKFRKDLRFKSGIADNFAHFGYNRGSLLGVGILQADNHKTTSLIEQSDSENRFLSDWRCIGGKNQAGRSLDEFGELGTAYNRKARSQLVPIVFPGNGPVQFVLASKKSGADFDKPIQKAFDVRSGTTIGQQLVAEFVELRRVGKGATFLGKYEFRISRIILSNVT